MLGNINFWLLEVYRERMTVTNKFSKIKRVNFQQQQNLGYNFGLGCSKLTIIHLFYSHDCGQIEFGLLVSLRALFAKICSYLSSPAQQLSYPAHQSAAWLALLPPNFTTNCLCSGPYISQYIWQTYKIQLIST